MIKMKKWFIDLKEYFGQKLVLNDLEVLK